MLLSLLKVCPKSAGRYKCWRKGTRIFLNNSWQHACYYLVFSLFYQEMNDFIICQLTFWLVKLLEESEGRKLIQDIRLIQNGRSPRTSYIDSFEDVLAVRSWMFMIEEAVFHEQCCLYVVRVGWGAVLLTPCFFPFYFLLSDFPYFGLLVQNILSVFSLLLRCLNFSKNSLFLELNLQHHQIGLLWEVYIVYINLFFHPQILKIYQNWDQWQSSVPPSHQTILLLLWNNISTIHNHISNILLLFLIIYFSNELYHYFDSYFNWFRYIQQCHFIQSPQKNSIYSSHKLKFSW